MHEIQLKENITFLRKEKGITQEELAKALGVTNQAVSKWESGQCCPDIQLLPELATYFGVSVDRLLGVEAKKCEGKTLSPKLRETVPTEEIFVGEVSWTIEALIQCMQEQVNSLTAPEDAEFVLQLVYALHACYWSKEIQKLGGDTHSWDEESVVKAARQGQWGLSCITRPEITAYMRCESVFVSSNHNLRLDNTSIQSICGLLKDFADKRHLKGIAALYELTISDEKAYADKAQIAEKSGLSMETVEKCLEEMDAYIEEKIVEGKVHYRIAGMYERVVPLLAMLSITA